MPKKLHPCPDCGKMVQGTYCKTHSSSHRQLPTLSSLKCVECKSKPQHTFSGLCRSCCQKGSRCNKFGKPVSESTRKIMSDNAKRRTGEKNSHYGKKNSDATKAKISKGLKTYFERHPQGNRGEYPPEFNKQLKEQIKQRDGYRCQWCQSEKDLTVHHVDYDKRNCHPNNLLTLCRSCNTRANLKSLKEYKRAQLWELMFWRNLFVPRYEENSPQSPSLGA